MVDVNVHHLMKEVDDPRLYAGIDYRKRYSQVHIIDQGGRTRTTAQLANDGLTVEEFFQSLSEPCGLMVNTRFTEADGYADRRTALAMVEEPTR